MLRKKSPFFCRTQIAGKYTCLVALAEADGNLCVPCAAKAAEIAAKPLERPAPVAAIETQTTWAERVALGPIWPA